MRQYIYGSMLYKLAGYRCYRMKMYFFDNNLSPQQLYTDCADKKELQDSSASLHVENTLEIVI